MTTSSDEIDLLEIFAKAILAVRNNFVTILVSFFVGSMLGLAYYQYSPNVYESRMLINSDLLTEDYSKSAIENLSGLIKDGNTNSLAQKLKLSANQAGALVSLAMKSTVEKPTDPLGVSQIYINIEASATDNSIWPELQNSIMRYFEDNEFVKSRVEQRKKLQMEMIKKIDLELADLDQLREHIASGNLVQSDKKNPVLFEFNLTEINLTSIELNEKKMMLQNSLENANGVQLMEGFAVFNKPASPKLLVSLVAGMSLGLLFAGLVVAFKAIRSLLRFSEEKLGKV